MAVSAVTLSRSQPRVVKRIVARGCCVEENLEYLVELVRALPCSAWHFRRDISRVHNTSC